MKAPITTSTIRQVLSKTFVTALSLFLAQPVYAQTIRTVAGTGTAAHTGDSGPATAATLSTPWSAKADAAGNVYIADEANNCIRKIDLSGTITTVAGTTVPGFSGDGGPATAAKINNPYDVAVDASGNLYIADYDNNRIRKVNTSGIISTIAGNGIATFTGDGGPATAASIYGPATLAIDATGNIYLSTDGTRVRKINTAGIISTFAGTSTAGFTGDGGPATAARMYNPIGIACDASGNVYISDQLNNCVRKVNASGIISTVAGSGSYGYSGDGGPATLAQLTNPWGIAVDSHGNLVIGDHGSGTVRVVNSSGTIYTIAGTGTTGFSGDGGPATAAKLSPFWNIGMDVADNIYVADAGNNRVRKISSGVNNAPSFIDGRAKYLNICSNSVADSINNILSITDPDLLQTETWSALLLPMHGTLSVTTTAPSTAGKVVPTGMSYTPTAGYSGTDTFSIIVNDGMAADTAQVYVTIDTMPHVTAIKAGAAETGSVCKGKKISLSDATTGGLWTSSDTTASVSSTGVVTGLAAGTTTISYTVTNGGCAVAATYPVKVVICPAGVIGIASNGGEELRVWPTPNHGTFTVNCSSSFNATTKIVITNVVGVKVKELTVNNNQNYEVNLDVPGGTYLLSAVNERGERSVTKITIY